MIDIVIIFSVKRGKDRQMRCKQYLMEAGVPEDAILIWNGIDHQDFQEKSELAEFAIQARGYAFFQDAVKNGYVEMCPKPYIAQSLSYFDVLMYLHAEEKTGIIIFDDHAIYKRQFSEIQEKLAVEVPESFYMVSISKPLMFETDENYKHLKFNKKTWDWKPMSYKVTMNGLQTPSESGLILSPGGAGFLAGLFVACSTDAHFIELGTTTFELVLDHQMQRLNSECQHIYSFSHEYLKLYHYGETGSITGIEHD